MAESTQPEQSAAMIERPASTAIMAVEQYDSTSRMAKALAHSGSFKDIGREEWTKALARIMLGADLGMSPTQALMGIDIVKGNPQIRGVALGRMVRLTARRPTPTGESYDFAVLDRGFQPDAEYAIVALYRRDEDGSWPIVEAEDGETFPTSAGPVTVAKGRKLPEAVEAFVLDQARKRKLIKSDGTWESQPEVMCVWRALSQLVRFYAPDVIGGMPVYTEADGLREVNLSTGQGDGSEPGWQGLPPHTIAQAEAVIAYAAKVGHAGYADRATMQMQLAHKSPEQVAAFFTAAGAELDKMPRPVDGSATDDDGPGEAFVNSPDPSDEERALDLERQATDKAAEADDAENAGEDDRAEMLRGEARALADAAGAVRSGQLAMDEMDGTQ